jgi:hypothetical protein
MSKAENDFSSQEGLPQSKPFLTLSEALTWLALRRVIDREELETRLWSAWTAAAMAPRLPEESQKEWEARIARAKALAAAEGRKLDCALAEAAERLFNMASENKIAMYGQEFQNCLDVRPDVRTDQIPACRFHDYRCFDPLNDTLYRGNGLAWVRVSGGTQLCSQPDERQFRYVVANRCDFEREFYSVGAGLQGRPDPFAIAEIDDWIRSKSFTGMKVARREFMKQPRAQGLSATFEKRWNYIKQNKRGRPRKVNGKNMPSRYLGVPISTI